MKENNRSNKLLIVIIVVLLLTIIGLGGYIVYENGFFKSNKDEVQNKNKITKEDESEEEDAVLTNSEKEEISTKISQILFGGRANYTGNSTPMDDEQHSGTIIVKDILKYATVSDNNKALVALNLVSGTKITDERKQKSALEVKQNYKDYFGNDWKEVDVGSVSLCPYYSYDSNNNVFYAESACGGTTSVQVVLHKENYVLKKDTATVDIYVATLFPNESNGMYVSSEIDPIYGQYDMNKIITNTNYTEKYILSDTDKEKANKYKITFKKDTEGKFYFYSLSR